MFPILQQIRSTYLKFSKEPTPDTTVYPLDLTEENFAEKVKDSEWLILFYAPWCPHCQQYKPLWNEYSRHQLTAVKTGQVDW